MLVASGITTRNTKLVVTKGIATSNNLWSTSLHPDLHIHVCQC